MPSPIVKAKCGAIIESCNLVSGSSSRFQAKKKEKVKTIESDYALWYLLHVVIDPTTTFLGCMRPINIAGILPGVHRELISISGFLVTHPLQ